MGLLAQFGREGARMIEALAYIVIFIFYCGLCCRAVCVSVSARLFVCLFIRLSWNVPTLKPQEALVLKRDSQITWEKCRIGLPSRPILGVSHFV